jgi:hypothetical protein
MATHGLYHHAAWGYGVQEEAERVGSNWRPAAMTAELGRLVISEPETEEEDQEHVGSMISFYWIQSDSYVNLE